MLNPQNSYPDMRLLVIVTDRKIFESNSAVRIRQIEYGKLFKKIDIIVFGGKRERESEEISGNITVYSTSSKNTLFYIFDALRIAKKIINSKKDLIISTQDPFETGFVGLVLKLRYKLPLHVQLHTDFANRYFIFHSFLNLVRFTMGEVILSFADSVRVVSNRSAKSVHNLAESISVLPIWVSQDNRQKTVDVRENKQKVRVLMVSRLEKEKNIETAIKAFARVKADAELVIVGDGSERESLEKLSNVLGLGSKVYFAGWQNNLEEFYSSADIFVSTSLYEGYGMSTVEAASHGLALVLSDAGIANEIPGAIVCKPKDIDGFAKALEEFISKPELRIESGNKNREWESTHLISKEEYLQKFRGSIVKAEEINNRHLNIFKKNILIRYLVAGLTGASINIGILFILSHFFGIWYITASIIAFVISIIASFLLQKLWTFGDKEMSNAHYQFGKYMLMALLGIILNTAIMFVLVDLFNIWYILGQIITNGFIAVFNFLMYKFFIFRKK